jgi:hypothetical protein
MIESGELRPAKDAPLKLSLVIPAYNEALRLKAGIGRLKDAIAMDAIVPESTEFILVDDGSTDGTAHSAKTLLAEYPHVHIIRLETNQGKGSAVRAGIAAASAPIIVFADADMAIDPAQTPQFIEALSTADLAIGSRLATGATVDRSSFGRSIMNRSFNWLANAVTHVSLDDTQCGFKAFRTPVAKLLFHCTVTQRMAFDVEVLSMARRMGFSITQVPVHWRRVKGSQVRTLADSPVMLRDVFHARTWPKGVPPLDAIAVKLPDLLETEKPHVAGDYLRELSMSHPVIRQSDQEFLVLCPLMDDAAVQGLHHQMSRRLPGALLTSGEVAGAEVPNMAPLTLTWDDRSIAPPIT